MRLSLSVRATRAASVCWARSPKFWLGLLSTMTAATDGIGSRSSRVSEGIGEREHHQAQRQRTQRRAAAARDEQQAIEISTATANAAHTT